MTRTSKSFIITLFTMVAMIPAQAFAGTLTVYAIPSPRGIDWSTPKTLTWSAARNNMSPGTHKIGHANIHLRCATADGDDRDYEILTGMTTGEDDPTMRLLKQEGYGLGILFATVPGRLESTAEVSTDLHHRFETGNVNFLQFAINPTTCARLADYATEYQARGYDQAYGLPNRPRHGEGAGCTAFAASFLELAGLHSNHLRSRWNKTRLAPAFLTGGPLTGHFVPLMALLRPLRPLRWARPDEPHYAVNFYDPDALVRHIESSWNAGRNPLGDDTAAGNPDFTMMGIAKGFVFDATAVRTPNDPVWSPPSF
jgi:hypothetical protein